MMALALPRYFNHLESSRETILKQDLAVMRDAIDKYHSDRGRYPEQPWRTGERAVSARTAVDPITERSDTWQAVAPSANEAGESEAGELYDIKSGAPGTARDGSAYADW